MDYTRIEKYINTIEPIEEGRRNERLSVKHIGGCFRGEFGLTGDNLFYWLSKVNQLKCTPPLSDAEVQTIARSVDRADMPAGDASTTHNKQHVVKTSKPLQTKHMAYRCTCADSVGTHW